MKRIEAVLREQEMLCIEASAGPCSMVVFGASGDLAHRKLFGSLYELFRRELISRRFYCIGCGRSEYSDEGFRDKVRVSLKNTSEGIDEKKLNTFLRQLYYVAGG